MRFRTFLLPLTIITFFIMMSCASTEQFQAKNEYKLKQVVYNIEDDRIREVLEQRKQETAFAPGQALNKKSFEKERKRIVKLVQENVDAGFDKDLVTFLVDTALTAQKYSVEVKVRRSH